jgi:hypothetical protein
MEGDKPMRRDAAFELAGDLVDIINIHLSRVEALSEAILLMEENGRDWETIGSLSDMIGDEAHKARTEVDKWWDSLMAKAE